MNPETATEQASRLRNHFDAICGELSKVVVGHRELIRHIYICLLCGGHALIEGVPGLGKTLLVKTFSRVLNLSYSRIQFTPDLMPADILGTNIVSETETGSRYFEFYKGPVFGQIILADEINRATPKTQSALLEAMQENRVTIFGKEYPLDQPFIVLATQNPLEMEGTYPLPEAQTDRFFFKMKVPFPDADQLAEIVNKTTEDTDPEINTVMDGQSVLDLRSVLRQVPIASHVKNYAIRLVLASHPDKPDSSVTVRQYVRYGASPRAVQALVMAAKVNALLDGKVNVSLSNIRENAKPALRHRIILNLKGEAEGIDPDDIIEDLVKSTPERDS